MFQDANLPHGVAHDNQNSNDSLSSFLILEITFSADIIKKIHNCLVIISKVLKGITLTSVSVSEAMDSLVKQKVCKSKYLYDSDSVHTYYFYMIIMLTY